jgi:hypothetical protein
MAQRNCVVVMCIALAVPVGASGQTPAATDGWRVVNELPRGTRIVVTLQSNTRSAGRFISATVDEVAIERGGDKRVERLAKSLIAKVTTDDPLLDGIGRGAAIGAGGALSIMQTAVSWCRTGCENDMPAAAAALVATMGGTIGSLAGLIADVDAGGSRTLYPPAAPGGSTRPSVRFGPVYTHVLDRSGELEGSASAPGVSFAFQPSPHVTYHVEYRTSSTELRATPGSVRTDVLNNEVPATARIAGWTRGLYSRETPAALTHLLGAVLPELGPVRVELLAGVEVQRQRDRDYYDAHSSAGQRLPGKYYVLDFESPEIGLVFGADAEVRVFRSLSIVPGIRLTRMSNRSSTGVGAGVQWRF